MPRELSVEERRGLLTSATLQMLMSNKSLIPDLIDLRNQVWKELENNPYDSKYAKPLILQYAGGAGAGFLFDGTGLLGSSVSLGGAVAGSAALANGGVGLGLLAGGAKLYRDAVQSDRATLGAEIWRTDYNLVSATVSNLWELEASLGAIVSNPQVGPDLRASALAALKRFGEWRAENDLPDAGTPVEQLLLTVPGAADRVRQAGAQAAKEHDPASNPKGYEKALLSELVSVGEDVDEIKELLDPLTADLKERLSARLAAQQAEELEKSIANFVGTGKIIGLLVGLRDPRAGAAISTVFEQSAVLYKSVKTMQAALEAGKAIQIATVASGFGAAFAIAGVFSSLGANGAGPTEAILDAIRAVLSAISELSKQINNLALQLREFSVRTELNFAELNAGITFLARSVGNLEITINAIKLEDIRNELFEAVTSFRASPSDASALKLLEKAYSIGISQSARDSQTGESASARRLAALVFNLADTSQPNPLGADRDPKYGGSPLLLSTALERYPTLLARAANWFQNADVGKGHQWAEVLSIDANLTDAQSRAALQGHRAISPGITAMAVEAMTEVMRLRLLRPDLFANETPPGPLTVSEMTQDLVTVATWPLRAVAALGTASVVTAARLAYFKAARALVEWVIKERVNCTSLLRGVDPRFRVPLLLGATMIYEQQPPPSGWSNSLFITMLDKSYPSGTVKDLAINADALLSETDTFRAWCVLQLFTFAGRRPELVSLGAWTDSYPFPEQPWLGFGNYQETFAIRIPDGAAASGFLDLFYVTVVDAGQTGPSTSHYARPIERGRPGGDWEIVAHEFIAARGRIVEVSTGKIESPDQVNNAPFTDAAYESMAAAMANLGNPAGNSFYDAVSEMTDKGIELSFYYGQCPQVDIVARANLLSAVADGLAREGAPGRQLDAQLRDFACEAWLHLAATSLASLEHAPANLQSVYSLVNRCPLSFRDDQLVNSVFASQSTQAEFWFDGFCKMLLKPPSDECTIKIVSKSEFDQVDAASGMYDAWVCPETLGVLISTNEVRRGPHQESPRVSSLPVINRALSSVNSLNLLTMQLTGWQKDGEAVGARG